MSKEKAVQVLRDGLDFAGVVHISTQNRQEIEGDVLTIPAELLLMLITEMSAVMFKALDEIEPGQGQKYIDGSHQRILSRFEAATKEAQKLEDAGAVVSDLLRNMSTSGKLH